MPQQTRTPQDEVRRANLSLVLTLLHQRGGRSRSQIGAVSGLNRSTVAGLVSELESFGLVEEQPGVVSGVGRPSLMAEPVATSAVTLALDVRVERTVAAVVGLGGQILVRQERRHTRALGDPGRIVREAAATGREVLSRAPSGSVWVGTGVGVPGIVRSQDGLVRQAPNLGWSDVPFGDLLSDALESGARSVRVRNDADLGGLAEHVRGAARDSDAVVYIAGDVGIGGGLIVDGRPLMGAGGYGGEVGHMRVNPVGRTCRCGAVGCWETEVGADAVVQEARVRGANVETPADVIALARAGDGAAAEALGVAAAWLGFGLVNLLHLLNPRTVVLGGHLADVHDAAPDAVLGHLDGALPSSREQVRVVSAALGEDATLVGGSEVAFTELLDDPAGLLSSLSSTWAAAND